MSKSWEYDNNDLDFTPEVVLKTDGSVPADKFLLRNIARGVYGSPIVSSFVEEGGFASALTLKFSGAGGSAILESFSDVSMDLSFRKNNTPVIKHPIAARDEAIENPFLEYSYKAFVKDLFAKTKNFDKIANYSPKVIIKRYKPEKTRYGNVIDPGSKKAGWHKSEKYVSEIPLTSANQKLDLKAEQYFDIITNGLNAEDELKLVDPRICSRGIRETANRMYSGKTHLQLSIELTIDGVKHLSNPLAYLTLSAINNMNQSDLTQNSFCLFVSYKLKT